MLIGRVVEAQLSRLCPGHSDHEANCADFMLSRCKSKASKVAAPLRAALGNVGVRGSWVSLTKVIVRL